MSALEDDELAFERTNEWNLPTDPEGFLAWLAGTGVDLETFKTYPAWANAPAGLRAALG